MSNASKPVDTAPTPIRPEDILTPQELAARLKVNIKWVYARSGTLPRLGSGRLLRFSWTDICEWLRRNDSL